MASGVPVVATSVALQGLAITDADGARRADDPEAFAREVSKFLQDPAWRRESALRARRYVERCHSWDVQGARLGEALRAIAERRARPARTV
jgi:glycosyltransferase involved in cell wall biosynthesis